MSLGMRESSRGVFSAFCAALLGLGLARFAYTPLIPALIAAHWFSSSEAVFLGAANMAGYLAGALSARLVVRWIGLRTALRLFMLLATASLLACCRPASFAWFCGWRLASGFAGAGLLVLPAPAVLPFVPAARRGLAGGVIFTGIGLGIALSGTALPMLLRAGPQAAWLGLAGAGAIVTVLAWGGWPDAAPVADEGARPPLTPALLLLFLAYALSAIGQVPSMLFLSDFFARGLGLGVAAGSHAWAVFGLGALVGPLGAGLLADRIGFPAALRVCWVTQVAACLVMAWAPGAAAVALAGMVVGAGIPGLVVLVLGRTRALANAGAPLAWGVATTCFALGQAGGAYGLSLLFRQTGRYALLFVAAILAMAAAFLAGEFSRAAAGRAAARAAQ